MFASFEVTSKVYKMNSKLGKRFYEEIADSDTEAESKKVKIQDSEDDAEIELDLTQFKAYCEERLKYYRRMSSDCSNQLMYIENNEQAEKYVAILKNLSSSSKIDGAESPAGAESEPAKAQPVDESDIHPIYGDISKYDTNDVDTDVE
jgi:hypothetical protein